MLWLWVGLTCIFVFAVCWFGFLNSKIQFKTSNTKARKIISNLILILILADACSTLIGQPDKYWQDYSKHWEANPLGKILLKWHPMAFVAGLIFWALIISCLIRLLPKILSQFIFLILFLGHSWAVFSWLPIPLKRSFYFQCLFCFILAIILLVVIRKYFNGKNS